jgi:hypothetical protein
MRPAHPGSQQLPRTEPIVSANNCCELSPIVSANNCRELSPIVSANNCRELSPIVSANNCRELSPAPGCRCSKVLGDDHDARAVVGGAPESTSTWGAVRRDGHTRLSEP